MTMPQSTLKLTVTQIRKASWKAVANKPLPYMD